jgi:hypothetical protein
VPVRFGNSTGVQMAEALVPKDTRLIACEMADQKDALVGSKQELSKSLNLLSRGQWRFRRLCRRGSQSAKATSRDRTGYQ